MAAEVKTAGLLPQAIKRLQQRQAEHIRRRAREFSDVVKATHRNAPRGGENLNRFGEQRSAPGEPPAMETGALFAQIDQGVDVDMAKREARVVANYAVLENGTRKMEPRPLGRISLAKFKADLK